MGNFGEVSSFTVPYSAENEQYKLTAELHVKNGKLADVINGRVEAKDGSASGSFNHYSNGSNLRLDLNGTDAAAAARAVLNFIEEATEAVASEYGNGNEEEGGDA